MVFYKSVVLESKMVTKAILDEKRYAIIEG